MKGISPPLGVGAAENSPSARRASPTVVGIGASAGGLDAMTKLITATPTDTDCAFVLVQHLDPMHPSLLAELLGEHTAMPVVEAVDGTPLLADHAYVIPPGVYLSVEASTLHLSPPSAKHGARLPIDHLFASLAKDTGDRAVGVILSGTGTDGTVGAQEIAAAGGLVIAQDPREAEFDGMPQSAIGTGTVCLTLPAAKIPAAIQAHIVGAVANTVPGQDPFEQIIALLRASTEHDFRLYKRGTLQRRVERRMALASIPVPRMSQYLQKLRSDSDELKQLASDLLINVTSFFRDEAVFLRLANTIVPEIVAAHRGEAPLRIWVAGCSTGEEVYSLAILFQEAIAAAKRTIKLCVFASDADVEAVAAAREGLYPDIIVAQVSPERLAKFFTKEVDGYRVAADLRSLVVFTVQDILTDPPFSRLDFVSCRNLLIYLGPEAQAKALALFHFALKRGGVLLLGGSETIGHADGQFETIAKTERIYRAFGKSKPGGHLFSAASDEGKSAPRTISASAKPWGEQALRDLCCRLIADAFAPAAILIDRQRRCLYSIGPAERYLRVAPGYPTHDLLAMATRGLRTRLRTAIERVDKEHPHITVDGGRAKNGEITYAFDVDVRRVSYDSEELLLVAFVDRPGAVPKSKPGHPARNARVSDLEQQLDTARADLAAAVHDFETSGEEHRAVNEEALSVNEEYQSANEELLTSKEELQSLNEELTALNGQLQETLERQRTTANDLQNVLYSTDVATLFLDTDLRIRFFTPATRSLFSLIPGDIGRPLADLRALHADPALIADVGRVLGGQKVADVEVAAIDDVWFLRRMLPYRTHEGGVEGVVITFTDITERKTVRKALESAKREAEQANLAKSRFLAAASHDLRQPLQSLALLQGLLARAVDGERAHGLIARLDQTLVTMSTMLNTMLDINQIEAGVVRPELVDFNVCALIESVRVEFSETAKAQHVKLSAVRCDSVGHSDPRILEQMLRNLVSNAVKYTRRGKILIGCRPRGATLVIEVWDTGVGIAASELDAIFDEYHQVDNAARERSLGLGLGLAIVQRLGKLLGHKVSVRSIPGRGSVFSIAVPRVTKPLAVAGPVQVPVPAVVLPKPVTAATVLVIDDDPDLRGLLEEFLSGEGHHVVTASDATTAITVLAAGPKCDLILADYNLPGGTNGLALAKTLRVKLDLAIPVIILTGDISAATLRDVAAEDCVQLNKPVKLVALAETIGGLLRGAQVGTRPPATVHLIDDDPVVRETLRELLEQNGRTVEDYADCEAFLAGYQSGGDGCLLVDAYLPGISGVELLRRMANNGTQVPAIMITGSSDVAVAVAAMKAGAIDFIEKPVGATALLAAIDRALELSRDAAKLLQRCTDAAGNIAQLTRRQHEVMDLVLGGHPSKNIAADLHISQRTVENHRAAIMRKTGTKSLPELARLAQAATPALAA